MNRWEGWGDGEPMELRHSEVGRSNRGTIADTAISFFFFILIGGAVKLGRGRRDERARSIIAFVPFGFGSAENVLSGVILFLGLVCSPGTFAPNEPRY